MTEIRNLDRELGRFRVRLLAAAGLVLLAFGLLAARMLHLQVFEHERLATQAENNRIAVLPVAPNRGLIVDRHGVVLATNYAAHTLEITPTRVPGGSAGIDALIDELAEVVEISERDRSRFRRLRADGRSFDSLPIRTRLSDEEVARFTAQRFRFPGAEVRARLFRHYPLGETGAHLLGYIGRINAAEKKAMEDWSEAEQGNYKGTDVIGKLGVEQRYERALHGTAGFEQVETSAGGRPVRRLDSRPATPGDKVVLTVDIRLQALVEELFGERRGALVAIDPRNGEVLALVSKPGYDPNLFVDGIDHDSWRELNDNPDRPLLNRALRGTYPPGSTFKPFMAMAALQSGKRSAGTVIQDGGSFFFGGREFRSHGGRGAGPVDMHRSIVRSSNVYYYTLANEMGVDLMHSLLSPMGFGSRTGIDLDGEATGVLPSTEWKRRTFRTPEQQRWYAGETISLGIGQGYNNFTMLQLAHATATLAAGGQRHQPHVVQAIDDAVSGERRVVQPEPMPPVPFKPEHAALILRAMHGVTQEGTSTRIFAGAPYASGGKTGTAQAVGIAQGARYDAAKLEERQRNHSLYIAVAPIEAPTVALAVIVENAGFGATAAAPIARRVFDYLLLGQYPSEQDIALTQRGESAAPVGTPRRADDVQLPGQDLPAAAALLAEAVPEPRADAARQTRTALRPAAAAEAGAMATP
jgi:penicillin-binding protein 2